MLDNESKILLGIEFILLFVNIKYAIYFAIFVICIYLFGFFFTSIGLDIHYYDLKKGTLYYHEYTGDYDKLYSKLSDYRKIKRQFKLDSETYNPFGIFYDDPTEVQDKDKCRAVIGIYKEGDKNLTNELKTYVKHCKFIKTNIKETKCIFGCYFSFFSIVNSFEFIAKLIIDLTNSKFFRQLFLGRWKENKIKIIRNNYKKHYGVIEVFREGKLEFYLPTEKGDEKNFFLHSEDKAPTKVRNKKKN